MKKRIFPTLLGLVSLLSIGGVAATWHYAENSSIISISDLVDITLSGFVYTPEEMPDEQVTAIQRLSDILNKKYEHDGMVDSETGETLNSLDYLLEETIQVYWNNNKNGDPYVASFHENENDQQLEEAIEILFEDVLFETNVSFILKNQDLNGDGYNEIAMYSTSNPLDYDYEEAKGAYDGVVCVYVTVFTPMIDNQGKIIGYTMVCESLRGYCYEICYSQTDIGKQIPSFSTDEWRSSVAYTRNNRDYELPDSAKSDYDSYNKQYYYNRRYYTTKPYGNTLSKELEGKIPYLTVQ